MKNEMAVEQAFVRTGKETRKIMEAISKIIDTAERHGQTLAGTDREERALRIYALPTPEERAEVWDRVEAIDYYRSREILWDGRLGRDPDDPREYLVTWRVELFAASKLAAAQQAFEIQRDPNSTATCFEVEGSNPDDIYTFDLVDSQPSSPVPASMIEALAPRAVTALERAVEAPAVNNDSNESSMSAT